MFFLKIALLFILYTYIGSLIGLWSWKVYKRHCFGWQTFLLFPLQHGRKKYYSYSDTIWAIQDYANDSANTHSAYRLYTAVIWPLRIIWNVPTALVVGVVLSMAYLESRVVTGYAGYVENRERVANEKEVEARTEAEVVKAVPVEVEGNLSTRVQEHAKLTEQVERINQRLAEIESDPDFEKARALANRL